jgi:hypothetical protein
LAVVIEDMQAESALDAEGQVLLARLLEKQASTRPADSGAYFRLLISRYKAEQASTDDALSA